MTPAKSANAPRYGGSPIQGLLYGRNDVSRNGSWNVEQGGPDSENLIYHNSPPSVTHKERCLSYKQSADGRIHTGTSVNLGAVLLLAWVLRQLPISGQGEFPVTSNSFTAGCFFRWRRPMKICSWPFLCSSDGATATFGMGRHLDAVSSLASMLGICAIQCTKYVAYLRTCSAWSCQDGDFQ